MLLPLGFGVMSLVTMAAITCLLVVEKLSRRGLLLGRVAGAALVVWSAVAMAGGG
jgi:predicted metal-binding membrane protein